MRPTVGGCLGGVRVEGGCWSVFRAEPGSPEAGVAEARCVDEEWARKVPINRGLAGTQG